LKALIARNLYDGGAFYEIINPIFPTYKKALEIMDTNTFDQLGMKRASKMQMVKQVK
jgi:hypothetical protein